MENLNHYEEVKKPVVTQEHIAEAPYMECSECGWQVFEEKMMIKRISRFITAGATDSIVPVPVIVCSKCGHIDDLFKPKA